MFKIENNKIHITRGDIGIIEVRAKNDDGTNYYFKKGEIIRLNVVREKHYEDLLFHKDVIVESETPNVNIALTSEDTTIGDLINSPKKYYYEIVLNPDTADQTIVGYDENGAKEFILYPEAKDDDLQ